MIPSVQNSRKHKLSEAESISVLAWEWVGGNEEEHVQGNNK